VNPIPTNIDTSLKMNLKKEVSLFWNKYLEINGSIKKQRHPPRIAIQSIKFNFDKGVPHNTKNNIGNEYNNECSYGSLNPSGFAKEFNVFPI
jgi:hypothetical protein